MKRLLFRKTQRLVTNGQFMSVLSHKCWAQNSLARLYTAVNACGHPRLGISINKSCGNAATRNRIKRRIREVFRLNQHDIPQEYDYLLIISHKLTKTNKKQYAQQLLTWNRDSFESAFLMLVEKAVNKMDNRQRKHNG